MRIRFPGAIEEYLRTSFPGVDSEFREGELMERSVPDYLHGRTQLRLGKFFEILRKSLLLFPGVETRIKLREGLCLIPDVAVFWRSEPALVPDSPRLVAIEVPSLDDRLSAVREKPAQN